MSPQLSLAMAAIGRSMAAGGNAVDQRFSRDVERELLDICQDHDNSDRDLHGVHVLWDDVAGWRVRLIGCYGPLAGPLTRTERAALLMADAAMPFICDWERALERANNLAGALDYSPCIETDIKDALLSGIRDWGLPCCDVEACVNCMARAWRRATGHLGAA